MAAIMRSSADSRVMGTNRFYGDLIPRIVEMRKAGDSWDDIAGTFNSEGRLNRNGKPFTSALVRTLIVTRINRGEV